MAGSTTIFLGSGASIDAGYPNTSELYSCLDRYYSSDNNHKKEWDKFKKYRNYSKGRIGSILKSDNLELVLTLPDLLATALEEYDLVTNKKTQTKDRESLRKAKEIADTFIELLENFFNYLSFSDADKSVPSY